METKREHLMKHFATVLRNRALGKETTPSISPTLTRYFSRKELIEIVKKRFEGNIPKTHNLVELENEELVSLIEDDMYVIAYVTELWSQELRKKAPKKTTPTQEKPEKLKANDTIPKQAKSN